MPTVLITGASRGLGLEFTRQYLADGNTVIAACRSPDAAHGLAQLARQSEGTLSVVQVDVADTESVSAMRRVIAKLSPRDSGRFYNYDGREYPW